MIITIFSLQFSYISHEIYTLGIAAWSVSDGKVAQEMQNPLPELPTYKMLWYYLVSHQTFTLSRMGIALKHEIMRSNNVLLNRSRFYIIKNQSNGPSYLLHMQLIFTLLICCILETFYHSRKLVPTFPCMKN